MWYTNKNHAAYIKGWKNRAEFLKEDNRLLMRAISQSQKAADYILNLDKEGNPAYLKNLKFEENKEEKPKRNLKQKTSPQAKMQRK
ncbi:hypothetical protein [uncultured Mesonia sp.]|uniref:hypothetical protein n=1 Tax=uncultured Mesonia sp. TaxID=399731 RepID=UPI00374ECB6B